MEKKKIDSAMPSSLLQGAFILWFVAMTIWWVFMQVIDVRDTFQNYTFGLIFGLIPFMGGCVGLWNTRGWGGWGSVMGRATGFLSLGLISWAMGGLIWAYYNFFGAVDVPYPSLADVAYVISWPLWALGAIQLSLATGAKFSLRKLGGKFTLLLVPTSVLAFSYYLLVTVARGGTLTSGEGALKTFFDLAYPMGDVVILSLSLVIFGLSFRYFGGRYQFPIMAILAGFIFNYFADFFFSWTTQMETFYVGNWVDFLFMTAMLLLSVGIIGLTPFIPQERKQ